MAAVNRIDNVKTAVVVGAGAWGEIHPVYRAYARAVGFHIDPCPPGAAEAKGKVEAKVRLSRLRLDPSRRRWDGLEELQATTDQRIDAWAKRAQCPATGRSVEASWEAELRRLAPLPLLPEPFDVAVTRPVHKDATVQAFAEGRVVAEYPRRSEERLLIDPSCYEGEATDRVRPPTPLGKMGRKLQEIWQMPVEQRPLDLYAALSEVAR